MTEREIFQTMKLEIYNLEELAKGFDRQYWEAKDGMDAVAAENKAIAFRFCARSMKAAVKQMERVYEAELENGRKAKNNVNA